MKTPCFRFLLSMIGIATLATTTTAVAQMPIPYCPDASSVFINGNIGYSSSIYPTEVAIQEVFLVPFSFDLYNFNPVNIQIVGNQISFDAIGEYVSQQAPLHFVSFGILPAGDYTMTIRPTATNVTPNVACPVLSVPLRVIAGYTYVPVPGPSGSWLGLLAALAGALGIGALWRRQRQLHR